MSRRRTFTRSHGCCQSRRLEPDSSATVSRLRREREIRQHQRVVDSSPAVDPRGRGARTMRRTIAAVAVAASVLAPASALAECAWVLWWEETSTFSSYRTAEANIPGGKLDERETSSWNILGSY